MTATGCARPRCGRCSRWMPRRPTRGRAPETCAASGGACPRRPDRRGKPGGSPVRPSTPPEEPAHGAARLLLGGTVLAREDGREEVDSLAPPEGDDLARRVLLPDPAREVVARAADAARLQLLGG